MKRLLGIIWYSFCVICLLYCVVQAVEQDATSFHPQGIELFAHH